MTDASVYITPACSRFLQLLYVDMPPVLTFRCVTFNLAEAGCHLIRHVLRDGEAGIPLLYLLPYVAHVVLSRRIKIVIMARLLIVSVSTPLALRKTVCRVTGGQYNQDTHQ